MDGEAYIVMGITSTELEKYTFGLGRQVIRMCTNGIYLYYGKRSTQFLIIEVK